MPLIEQTFAGNLDGLTLNTGRFYPQGPGGASYADIAGSVGGPGVTAVHVNSVQLETNANGMLDIFYLDPGGNLRGILAEINGAQNLVFLDIPIPCRDDGVSWGLALVTTNSTLSTFAIDFDLVTRGRR